MIKKLLIFILFILIVQNISFSAESTNSKQIEQEKIITLSFTQYAEKDKSLPYKLLIIEDYMATYLIDGNNRTIGNDIKNLIKKYKNNTNCNNYKYAYKAYELYDALCMKIVAEREKQNNTTNVKEKIIFIPDTIYSELDDEILKTIFMLNVTAQHF